MSESTSTARPLGGWLALLEARQPPVDATVRDAALAELAGGRGSTASLASRLQADPAEVLLLFSEANRALVRLDLEVHSLEHAIALLGTERVYRLLASAPVLPADYPHATQYRQALLRSRHAAWRARLWAEGSGRWPAEEVFWGTLLMAAPLWLLWFEAGIAMQQLEQLRARVGTVNHTHEQQIFGCRIGDLASALAKRWRLPESPDWAGTGTSVDRPDSGWHWPPLRVWKKHPWLHPAPSPSCVTGRPLLRR